MILPTRHLYVINHCTKYLARTNTDDRHNYNNRLNSQDLRARIAEKWRFPIIDSYRNPDNPTESDYDFNQVTFVYSAIDRLESLPQSVAIVGTFANLYEPIPLESIQFLGEATGYYALTMRIPKGEKHRYKFLVDGNFVNDPINPQLATLENGEVWSRFFTQLCTEMLVLERWEVLILERLTDHILPFKTEEGERFLNNYYNFLDRQSKDRQYRTVYQFDESVGIVNFIDKLLAKEENHHLLDYRICLRIISDILRQRNPFIEPKFMSKELYIDIYNEMATDNVNGWNKGIYGSPRYFLEVLRRHTFTGAFAHPKYGGNAGASAWAFLSEKYKNQQTGQTLFNWQQALEVPLGTNKDYLG